MAGKPYPRPVKTPKKKRGTVYKGRYVATEAEWDAIQHEKVIGKVCRGCGQRFAMSGHHLVGKDLLGDDYADNIIGLCGSGTTGCHGILENHEKGWQEIAHNIRALMTTAERRYVIAKKSEVFLDRYYPKEVE